MSFGYIKFISLFSTAALLIYVENTVPNKVTNAFSSSWKFVATQIEEAVLLDYAISEVEKALSSELCDDREVAYIKSLMCSSVGNECEVRLNVLQSIFQSMSSWCDSKLQDYHLIFSQVVFFFNYYYFWLPIIESLAL